MADRDKQVFYWQKIDKDFFNEYKIKSLLSEPKGDTYCLILLALKNEVLNYVEDGVGILRYSPKRAYSINELASVINRPAKVLESALKVLQDKELLSVEEDGTIRIPEVNVGKITGQSLRKSGKDSVKITKELPQNDQENSVNYTLEIRDKRLDIEEEDMYKRMIDRYKEAGFSNDVLLKAIETFQKYDAPVRNDLFAKIVNILSNEEIMNKDGYCYEVFKREGLA